jgi:hypothetical protein
MLDESLSSVKHLALVNGTTVSYKNVGQCCPTMFERLTGTLDFDLKKQNEMRNED